MERKSFFKSLITLIAAPSILKDVKCEPTEQEREMALAKYKLKQMMEHPFRRIGYMIDINELRENNIPLDSFIKILSEGTPIPSCLKTLIPIT